MKKSSGLYCFIIFIWLICTSFLCYNLAKNIIPIVQAGVWTYKEILVIILLSVNTLILTYMWLGSVKDFIFSLFYLFNKKKLLKNYEPIYKTQVTETPKVLLLYCTCNDFNENALSKCMEQEYSNFETIILDDSSKDEFKAKVDTFSSTHNVKVVRREDRIGFKAGNLNNFLKSTSDYDYFVVLDSDEIIPSNYINEILKYFYYDKTIGAVQASHTATKGTNVFQDLMGMSIKSNSQTAQIVKNFYGSSVLIGHGMTISRECYEKTKEFPLVVAEDISYAIDIKNNGYQIVYAPNIICQEEFPQNYASLKKRQCKWTQGNVEFMKKYSSSINKSKMKWYEKLDVKLSHYNLPIIPILSVMLIAVTVGLGFLNFDIMAYSVTIFGLMILFLLSPLIPDLFIHAKTPYFKMLIPYFVLNIVTYASLSPMMIKTVFLGVMGKKAKFIVTPKEDNKISLWQALLITMDSILFAVIVAVLCYFACDSVLPVLLIFGSCILAPIVVLLANIKIKEKTKNKKEDDVVILNAEEKIS